MNTETPVTHQGNTDYQVRQTERPVASGPFRSDSMNDVTRLLLIDLRDMLSQIEVSYDISAPERIKVAGKENSAYYLQYTATRKASFEDSGVSTFRRKRISSFNSEDMPVLSSQGSPEVIIITVDPSQFQIQSIACKGLAITGMKYDLSFIRLEDRAFPENWFTPEAHLANSDIAQSEQGIDA